MSPRGYKSKVALIGDAAPILRRLIDQLAKFNTRASRKKRCRSVRRSCGAAR
jgi:hypothetical protein